MFTQEGWAGMLKVAEYARYLESDEVKTAEAACAPSSPCLEYRSALEHAYQVVANEMYDPYGRFSQAEWADTLLSTLKAHGGALRDKKELYTALRSMMESLQDPYSKFLSPTEFRRAILRPRPAERMYYDAMLVGPGVIVGKEAPGVGGWLIDAPVPESPAEAAGIRRNDVLLAVDGVSVDPRERRTAQAVRALLRGPIGSPVNVTVAHARPAPLPFLPPSYDLETLELDRVFLTVPPLLQSTIALSDGSWVRYLRVHFFSSEASNELKKALMQAEAEGVRGLILDLRGNPGGVFEESIGIASYFLGPVSPASTLRFAPDSPRALAQPPHVRPMSTAPLPGADPSTSAPSVLIAHTFRNDANSEEAWKAGELPRQIFLGHPGRLTERPLVVLVDSASASASEVLTGALKDNGR